MNLKLELATNNGRLVPREECDREENFITVDMKQTTDGWDVDVDDEQIFKIKGEIDPVTILKQIHLCEFCKNYCRESCIACEIIDQLSTYTNSAECIICFESKRRRREICKNNKEHVVCYSCWPKMYNPDCCPICRTETHPSDSLDNGLDGLSSADLQQVIGTMGTIFQEIARNQNRM